MRLSNETKYVARILNVILGRFKNSRAQECGE